MVTRVPAAADARVSFWIVFSFSEFKRLTRQIAELIIAYPARSSRFGLNIRIKT